MKIRFSYALLFVLFATNICAETLLDVIKKDDFLLQGGTSIISNEGERFLVSVGVAPFVASSSSSMRKAIIESKMKAQQQLSQFINESVVTTSEILEVKTAIQREGSKSPVRRADAQYIEHIREANEGPLKYLIPFGAWSDSATVYHATGIKLSQ